MTATVQETARTRPADLPAVARRLRPLAIGLGLQNMLFWVPVEKIFMTEIGFDAAAIGIVAAVYAAVVPLLEVPFGVLADRWSRTGVLVLATFALAASSLVGGLSNDPAMYVDQRGAARRVLRAEFRDGRQHRVRHACRGDRVG